MADLARSGLSPDVARKLELDELDAAAVAKLTKGKHRVAAYRFPYPDAIGAHRGPFYRLRFLAPTADGEGNPMRYWQPPKTGTRVYFPPIVDWAKILADPNVTVYLTEGEKKAIAGTSFLGEPVIGLGGVWSFADHAAREELLPELHALAAGGRTIRIVFDAEPVENRGVDAALSRLGASIWRAGGRPEVIALPSIVRDAKTGLDDFLVARGAEAFREIEARPFAHARELFDLNEELALIESTAAVYHLPTHSLFSDARRLTNLLYADRTIILFGADGKPREKNLVAEWLRWSGKRRHAALAYEPGGKTILDDGRLNVWPGWGVAPKRGDVSLFIKLVDHLFDGAERPVKRWFMQWLAFPLVHPGVKLYQASVLYGRIHGTGKSLIGETLGRIYGENFRSIGAEALHSTFNDWARHRQFVLGEELVGPERKQDAERLKLLVTQERVAVNVKYQPSYELPDRANYLLTTNHADAVNLDVYDRRFFVHEVVRGPLDAQWYNSSYDPWYRSDEGAGAVFHYLSKEVDLDGFNPRGPAPHTEAKTAMQELADGPVDYVLREFLAAPDRFLLAAGMREGAALLTASEICHALDPDGRGRYTAIGVAKALHRAGRRAMQTQTARGSMKLFAVRDHARWHVVPHATRAKERNAAIATTSNGS